MTSTTTFRSLATCLALSGVAVSLRLPVLRFDDFESYTEATRRALAGVGVYTADQLAGPYQLERMTAGGGFVYPPTAVPLLAWTIFGTLAAVIFMVLAFAALALVVVSIVRRSVPQYGAVAWPLASLILLSPPATDAIYVGQVTPLIAVGYGMSWLAPWSAGWWGVLGGALKLFPLGLVVWAFRQGANVGIPLAFGVGLIVISGAWLGFGAFLDYFNSATNGRPQCEPPSLGSLTCAFGSVGATGGLVIALLLVGVAAAVRSPALSLFLVAVAPLAAAPDVFPNYLLIVMVGSLPALTGAVSKLTNAARAYPVHLGQR